MKKEKEKEREQWMNECEWAQFEFQTSWLNAFYGVRQPNSLNTISLDSDQTDNKRKKLTDQFRLIVNSLVGIQTSISKWHCDENKVRKKTQNKNKQKTPKHSDNKQKAKGKINENRI